MLFFIKRFIVAVYFSIFNINNTKIYNECFKMIIIIFIYYNYRIEIRIMKNLDLGPDSTTQKPAVCLVNDSPKIPEGGYAWK